MRVSAFGDYDEILIVAEHVVSVEGVPHLDRAGQVAMLPSGTPRFVATMVGLDTGNSIAVPHTPAVVYERLFGPEG